MQLLQLLRDGDLLLLSVCLVNRYRSNCLLLQVFILLCIVIFFNCDESIIEALFLSFEIVALVGFYSIFYEKEGRLGGIGDMGGLIAGNGGLFGTIEWEGGGTHPGRGGPGSG